MCRDTKKGRRQAGLRLFSFHTRLTGYIVTLRPTCSPATKRGESLWTIAQQHSDIPVWLVAQYNPDVNFNDVRPGTQITLPRVEEINRQ